MDQPSGSAVRVRNPDGSHSVKIKPTHEGPHTLSVTTGGKPIHGGSLPIEVQPPNLFG